MSLHRFLTRMIWLCIAPLFLLGGYLAYQNVLTKQAERNIEATNLAKNFANAIDQHLNARIGGLHMLASSPLIDDPSRWRDLYREAQGFYEGFACHVVFADPNMRMLFNTRVPFGTPLPPLPRPKGNSAVQTVMETGKPAVGDVFFGPIAKEPLIAIAVPARRGDITAYLLLTIYETRRFQERLDRVSLPAGWSLTLLDGNREVIARRAPPGMNPAEDVDPSGRFAVPLGVSPWSVVLEIPRTLYRKSMIEAAACLAVAFLVATLASLLGGMLVGRHLGRAVASLAEAPLPGRSFPNLREIATVRNLLDESSTRREAAEAALQENLAILRAAQRLAGIGNWTWEVKTATLTWSEEMYHILGRDPALPPIGYPEVQACFSLESWTMLAAAVERVMTQGIPYQLDAEVVRPDGTRRWVITRGEAIRDGQGDVARLRGTVQDITERKAAEEKLRKSEEKYRIVADFTHDWEYWMDREGRFRYISPSVERLTGYTVADFQQDPNLIIALVHPDDRPLVEEHLTGIEISKPDEQSLAFRILKKDGEERWIGHVCLPVHLDDGSYAGRRASIRDISVYRQAEAALKKSEERYRLIAENTSDVIWLVDIASNRFTYVSPSVERLCGFTPEEVLAETIERAMTPETYRPVSAALSNRISRFQAGDESQRVHTQEIEQLCKDGSRVSTEVVSTLIADENGQVTILLGVSRDITERKRAEEEKTRLRDQLLQSQKMESVGRLAGGVAHDYNNMLTVILGHTEAAVEKVDPGDEIHTDLQEIRKAAERSVDLTRQLLAFARRQTIDPKVLNLNETIGKTLKMLRRLMGEDIHLAWHPDADLWPVKMDPSQIDQILANLCVNARDAIAEAGKITIETHNFTFDEGYCADHPDTPLGDFVMLAVSDNGCGMDSEVLGKLFEPFFTTKEMGKGTGLGLATVYGIIRQNNGFINVYSELGQGTTFKVYLPRHAGEAEQAKAETPSRAIVGGKETVLVVEDEQEILTLVRQMLEKYGYRVLTADTPGGAIQLAEGYTGEIHLLITDVVMPEMNGRELAVRLLALYPNLKCLFNSGYTADVIAHHGVLDEGTSFIQKPFSRKALLAKVRQTIEGT